MLAMRVNKFLWLLATLELDGKLLLKPEEPPEDANHNQCG